MKHRLIALTIVLCQWPALAKSWDPGTWAANTGALSYSIFNLSGDSCQIVYPTTSSMSTTANPAGANPYAAGNPAQSYGWNAPSSFWQTCSGDPTTCNGGGTGSNNLFSNTGGFQVNDHWVAYFIQSDPVQAPVTISNSSVGTGSSYITSGTSGTAWSTGWTLGASGTWPINNGKTNAIGNGNYQGLYEGTAEMNQNDTAAATADSFWVLCAQGTTNPSQAIMMANVASASDSFNAGEPNGGGGLAYNIDTTVFYPQAPGPRGSFSSAPAAGSNVNGAGFVADTNSVLNYSVSNSGGMWSTVVNNNVDALTTTTAGGATVHYTPANYNLVPAMFPVNLSNYVTASSSTGYTDIYGGHFTLAIGDPFIVSSFNAKILWYLASRYALTDADFQSASGIANMITTLTANPGGVFGGNGNGSGNLNANTYVSWLFGSASQAAAVAYASIQNATNSSSTEAFWGKLLNFALGVTMKMMNNYVGITNGAAQGIAQSNLKRTTASETTGYVQSTLSSAITGWATTTTANTPTTQNAPMVVNPSFSASNLLGMLLTNVVVQSQLNTATNTAVGESNPLWANYSMYFGTECVASSLSISGDFFPTGSESSGVVQCYNSNNVATNLTSTVGTYENVCSGWSASNAVNAATGNQCGADTGTELNLWNAVLGGTDLSPNSAGTELQTVNPSTSSFQPPTLIAATGVTQVNTDFNLTNGVLTLVNYYPSTAPASQPSIADADTFFNAGGCVGSGSPIAQGVNYDAGTGMLTATEYVWLCSPGGWGTTEPIPNGPISLNMNSCAAGSSALFNTVVTNGTLQSASFSCVTPVTPVTTVGNTTPPTTQPRIHGYNTHYVENECLGYRYRPQGVNYDAGTGMLTATAYQGGCPGRWTSEEPIPTGTISLNMSTCATGSAVQFNATATENGGLTAASFSCVDPGPPLTLDYNLCVNDPNATGGVLILNLGSESSPSPALACACIPFYAGGVAATSGATGYYPAGTTSSGNAVGILLGATSANPAQQCAAPSG